MGTVRRPRKPRDYSVAALEAIFPSVIRVMTGVREVLHADVDLTYNQFKALATVRNDGPTTLEALRRRLKISAATASALAARLVRAGLVERRTLSDGHRRLQFRISPRGRRHLSRIEAGVIGSYRHLLLELPVDDRLRLVEAFGVILDILCDHELRAQTQYG